MYIQASNPVIKKVLNDFLSRELYDYQELAYDTDNVTYKVYGDEDTKSFKFCFKSHCSKRVLDNGGREMLEAKYKEFLLPEDEWDPDFDVTLGINLSELPKTKKVKKTMDDAEADAVREENEKIRAEKKAIIEPIAERISVFKKDFLSAPIRKAFLASLDGKITEPVEVPYRADEKFWVMQPAVNEVQVYFGVNFSTEVDQSLGRVMLLEWQDSTRKVKLAPIIKFHDKDIPTELKKAFPSVANEVYSNGLISFSKPPAGNPFRVKHGPQP